MIHPHTELRYLDELQGFGVFATQKIPRGTVVWTLCAMDRLYTPQEIRALPAAYYPILCKYSYLIPEGYFVLCWDLGRQLNHSCEANIRSVGRSELAIRDIAEGEQITCEYGVLNFYGKLNCGCGFKDCRKIIQAEDVLNHYASWDALVQQALPDFSRVEQPLALFIQDLKNLEDLSEGRGSMPSLRSTYYPDSSATWQFLYQNL